MKEKLVLANPIKINGQMVPQVTYDADEITAQMFAAADAAKMRASNTKGGNLSGAVELDYGLHLYLGFMAIIAVNPDYDLTDLERIRGADVMPVMRIGRNFIISGSAANSSPDNSDEPSETTQEPTTPLFENSDASV